ncbi:MAG: Zn-ribbon domain-containing OB-fold protein [Gammaproteobacteria bacterium]|nr:Zn-ribbon domain-containing OB-fold protein [Gammaproteobacteria bacterium]
MSTELAKLMPVPTPETQGYWQGCNEGRLLIQRCTACGHHQFYPRLLCTACASSDVAWHEASGNGRVKSFTIIRRAVTEAYADDVPYVVALIELAEGPTMMSNVVGCDVEKVHIGMSVSVRFERRTEEIAVPIFNGNE